MTDRIRDPLAIETDPIGRPRRAASGPGRSAVHGSASGMAGAAAATAILANNPESALALALAPLAGAAITGLLSGAGTAARNRLHRDPTGFGGFFAQLFSWLG